MLFQQTSAPTGWTKVTSSNDVALRVVSGTVGSGGSVAFETAFTSQTIPTHTLTTSEIPGHTHNVQGNYYDGGWIYNQDILSTHLDGSATGLNWGRASRDTNGNATFTARSTGGGGSHGHGSLNLDVSYVDVIIATKD